MQKRRRGNLKIIVVTMAVILVLAGGITIMILKNSASKSSTVRGPIEWSSPVIINDAATFADAGQDARSINPGGFGSEYARLLKLKNGTWLAVYTVYTNNGYLADSNGGTQLEIAVSKDNCQSWDPIAAISDPGRDLDNGQMIQLKNGDIILGCRSVRWQESYFLPVYKSRDMWKTWDRIGVIDENNGKPGELGLPDKGVYEPHFLILDDGSLSVMYANEKHVVETPSYSQIISQKISTDGGKTWGGEIFVAWDPDSSADRPGMPVWTKMKNGRYIVVFEVVGTKNVDVFYKTSDDGRTWSPGIGERIQGQRGGPYILALSDGRLVVTSNTHQISISDDNGKTWYLELQSPFGSLFEGEDNLWPSLYQVENDKIAAVTSAGRQSEEKSGHNIALTFGTWNNKKAEIKPGSQYWLISLSNSCCLQAIEGDSSIKIRIADLKDGSQLWRVDRLTGGYFKIEAESKVLTLVDDNSKGNTSVKLMPWKDRPEQKWKLQHVGGGIYSIISGSTGETLALETQDAEGNAVFRLAEYNGDQSQRWELHLKEE